MRPGRHASVPMITALTTWTLAVWRLGRDPSAESTAFAQGHAGSAPIVLTDKTGPVGRWAVVGRYGRGRRKQQEMALDNGGRDIAELAAVVL